MQFKKANKIFYLRISFLMSLALIQYLQLAIYSLKKSYGLIVIYCSSQMKSSSSWNDLLECIKIEIDHFSSSYDELFFHRNKFQRILNELTQFSKNLSHFVIDNKTMTNDEFFALQKIIVQLSNLNLLTNKFSAILIKKTIKEEKEDFLVSIDKKLLDFIQNFNNQTNILNFPELVIDEKQFNDVDNINDLKIMLYYFEKKQSNKKSFITSLKDKVGDRGRKYGPNDLKKALSDYSDFLIEHDDIEIYYKHCIHHGKYYNVYFGIMKETNKIVAVELYHSSFLSEDIYRTIRQKVKLMSSLDHPSIAKFIGFITDDPICIISEFIPRGPLNKFHGQISQFDESRSTAIALGIAYAMRYIHSKDLVHLSLRGDNVFLGPTYFPKVRCGTSAKKVGEKISINPNEKVFAYTAPELFKEKVAVVTKKADIYSYGILLWEILTKDIAFSGLTSSQIAHEVLENDQRPLIPQHCPKSLSKLIQNCWNKDPSKRPDFNQICEMIENGYVSFAGSNINVLSNYIFIQQNQNSIEYDTTSVSSLISLFMEQGSVEDGDEFLNILFDKLKEEFPPKNLPRRSSISSYKKNLISSISSTIKLGDFSSNSSTIITLTPFTESNIFKLSSFFLSLSTDTRLTATSFFLYAHENEIFENEAMMSVIIPNLLLGLCQSPDDEITLPMLTLLNRLMKENSECFHVIKLFDSPTILTKYCFHRSGPDVIRESLDFTIYYISKNYASNEYLSMFLTSFINTKRIKFQNKEYRDEATVYTLCVLYLLCQNDHIYPLLSAKQDSIAALASFLDYKESETVTIACLKLIFTVVSNSNYTYYNYDLAQAVVRCLKSENEAIHAFSCSILSRVIPQTNDFSFFKIKTLENIADQNLNSYSLRLIGSLATNNIGSKLSLKVIDRVYNKLVSIINSSDFQSHVSSPVAPISDPLKMSDVGTIEERDIAIKVLVAQSAQTPYSSVLINAIPTFFKLLEQNPEKTHEIFIFLSNIALDPIGAEKCFEYINILLTYMCPTHILATKTTFRILRTYELHSTISKDSKISNQIIQKSFLFWNTEFFNDAFCLYESFSLTEEGRKILNENDIPKKIIQYIKNENTSAAASAIGKRILSRVK